MYYSIFYSMSYSIFYSIFYFMFYSFAGMRLRTPHLSPLRLRLVIVVPVQTHLVRLARARAMEASSSYGATANGEQGDAPRRS